MSIQLPWVAAGGTPCCCGCCGEVPAEMPDTFTVEVDHTRDDLDPAYNFNPTATVTRATNCSWKSAAAFDATLGWYKIELIYSGSENCAWAVFVTFYDSNPDENPSAAEVYTVLCVPAALGSPGDPLADYSQTSSPGWGLAVVSA
jgi:hypothetical protein